MKEGLSLAFGRILGRMGLVNEDVSDEAVSKRFTAAAPRIPRWGEEWGPADATMTW
jgi:hypothetical protein